MNFEDNVIEKLVLAGALEFGGIDAESGEVLYNFTEKLKEISPMLYEEHRKFVNSEIMYFWEHGFLDIENLMDDEPKVRVTQKCFDKEAIASLDKDKLRSLQEIMHILKVV